MTIDLDKLDAEIQKAKSLIGKKVESNATSGVAKSYEVMTKSSGYTSGNVNTAIQTKGYCVAVRYGNSCIVDVNDLELRHEVTVNLTQSRSATITPKHIEIGGQKYPHTIVAELAKGVEELKAMEK